MQQVFTVVWVQDAKIKDKQHVIYKSECNYFPLNTERLCIILASCEPQQGRKLDEKIEGRLIHPCLLPFLCLKRVKGLEKRVCAVLTPAGVKLSHLSCRQLLKRVGKDAIFIVKWQFFIPPSIPHLHSFLSQSHLHSLSLHIDLLISVLFCQDHMSEGTLSLAVRPQTLVSLTITALSFRVSFLSPGVSQHDSCSLQEQSHAKLPCSALSFPLALCLKEGVSRHIHTLNLSFTKLENNFSMWLGQSALFSSFF